MKDKLHVDNELQKIVQNELNSKTKFDKLDCSDISDFPKLEVDEIIKDITLGEFSFSS